MKEILAQLYLDTLREKLEKAKASYEVAKKDTIEAEGRMVTRYDSTKTETAWLADGYLQTVNVLNNCIENFSQQKPYVNMGDLIVIDIFKNQNYEGTKQILISKNEPEWESILCKLLGKVCEDMVLVKIKDQNYGYQIREIQKNHIAENKVNIGSLVLVEDEFDEQEWYYLVPEEGGVRVYIEEQEVFCISCMAPLTQSLLGRSIGENFKINGVEFKIITIR